MNYAYKNYNYIFEELLGGFAIFFVILGLLVLVWAICTVIALWKVYKKAGKNGWECIIPFYSYWVLTEIAEINWWWFLLAMTDSIISLIGLDNLSTVATLVSIFARFNIYYNIAKKFNKTNGTAVCAGIFSGIFILIFGFSKNEVYDASIPVSKNGIFGNPENEFNSTNNYGHAVTPSTTSVDGKNDSSVVDERTVDHSFCGNCGTKLSKDMLFCPNCGKENK